MRSTSPRIGRQPMSFVRLRSKVAGDYGYQRSEFTDSRGVPYKRGHGGAIIRVRKNEANKIAKRSRRRNRG